MKVQGVFMSETKNKALKTEHSLGLNTPAPRAFVELKQMFEQITERLHAEAADDESKDRSRSDFIEDFTQGFDSAAWSWRPITQAVTDHQVDRCGEVIMGPLYSCQEFPWPEASGFPMAPLIQLDLKKASEIGGVPLGDGLLQVWMPHDVNSSSLFVRVVPRACVEVSQLTPVVMVPEEMSPLQVRDTVWSDEQEEFVHGPSFQITGYEPQRFTCQIAHPIQDNHPVKTLTDAPEIQALIKDFDKKLKPLIKKGPKGFNPGDGHLFGTFTRVQYAASDMPKPLFCFESDDLGFMWGDGGNAQLFYEFGPDGQVAFTFNWSN